MTHQVKYNNFCDDEVIDDVTLRLLKFPDLNSRQTAGIAGDEIK